MKESLLKFLKWFFIILGVLFFIQIILISGLFMAFKVISESQIKPIQFTQTNIKTKEIQDIVDYADKYYEDNKTYPENVDIKIKKGEYKYKTTNNSKCYEIEYNYKNSQKTYGKCKEDSDGINSVSESYSEIKK